MLFPAVASANSTPSNSVVRFQIQRGTNALGAVDVELFDQDKPATVRNFLLYVRSGAYSNSFLHRCVPGFIVQGGGFSVTNPLGTARFSSFNQVTEYGRVTNEFHVGPQLSNTFGTLAMAKLGNDPNSATSQWFFNLGNNTTNLDNQNGGFTVFGRVIESTNANEGTNLLQHFNSLSTSAGIVNLGSILGSAFQVFSDLPVAYTNTTSRAPTNRELYYVAMSVLNQTNSPGPLLPNVSLLSPSANERFTNGPVLVTGTADDDAEVAQVVFRVQDGPWQIASGTTNWTASFTPNPGFNTVTVQSIDFDGNRSTNSASVTFFYAATVPLQLQVIGKGRVEGAVDGQILQVGRFYTINARPSDKQVFDRWTGSVSSASSTLTFQVPTNSTNFSLTATFALDPFIRLAGTYHGLFRVTNSPAMDNAGFLTLSMSKRGGFSGKILHRNGSYTYTGRFDSSGSAFVQGTVGGASRSMSLRLETANDAGLITGSLIGGSGTAEVQLERLASSASASNAPPLGGYTFAMAGTNVASPSPLTPNAPGFGVAKFNRSRVLNVSGTFGDGTSFATSAKLTRRNHWALYRSISGGRGVFLGWLASGTNQPGNLDANMQWMKVADSKALMYPIGFTNQLTLLASPYAAPAGGVRVLNWVNGLAKINGGNLVFGITNVVKLTTDNTLGVADVNASDLNFNVDLNSGRLAGTFVHPWSGATSTLRGVLLKRSEGIHGQFLDADQTGSLNVGVTPFLVTQSVVNVTLPDLSAALSEGGLLRFEGDGVITLTEPLPIAFNTALDANGHNVVITGGGTTRLFEVPTNTSFSATGITFADGLHLGTDGAEVSPPEPGGDGCGAGILNLGGTVTLTNCVLTNFVVRGGSASLVTTTNDTPAPAGRGLGAAICNLGGRVTLQSCELANNFAFGSGDTNQLAGLLADPGGAALGGALYSDRGECEIRDTIFRQNQARGGEALLTTAGTFTAAGESFGGALAISGGLLRLINSDCLTNSAVGPATPTNSLAASSARGGALFVETNAQAIIEQSRFTGNSALGEGSGPEVSAAAGTGGAIFSAGSLQLRDCTLDQNSARGGSGFPAGAGVGGALASLGSLVINASTLNDNLAQGGDGAGGLENGNPGGEATGGAIYAKNSSFAATNSTLAFNRAVSGSGASLALTNDGPRGDAFGGAITLVSNSAVFVHLTLALNQAELATVGATNSGAASGGGIAALDSTLLLRASVLASNLPGNLSGTATDSGFNVSSDASFAFTGTGSSTNLDPLLGPLTTNGGPTRTMALLNGSPARDIVPAFNLPATDQRGFSRVGNAGDSGAFEGEITPAQLSFIIQPIPRNVRAGTNVTFEAIATGAGPIGYVWQKDGVFISGATGTTFSLVNVQASDAGDYQSVATNSSGSLTSTVATLTVDSQPLILIQPSDVSAAPGSEAILAINVAGPALNYAWFHNDLPIENATNSVLILLSVGLADAGSYHVIVTNFAGSVTSRVAALTFNSAALQILVHPQSLTVTQAEPASLSVLVAGILPHRFQWFLNALPVPDATNDTLSFVSTDPTNAGTYRVVITNDYRSVTSSPALLTIVAPSFAPSAAPTLRLTLASQGTDLLITCQGPAGAEYRILRATDLGPNAIWQPITTNVMPAVGVVSWKYPAPADRVTYFKTAAP
jgi:cyclophilin family peptidyl-prolyl cis-trans isomerase